MRTRFKALQIHHDGVFIVKCQAKLALILLSVLAMIAGAQTPTKDQGAQDTQARDNWIDPSTGLMWAGKDNGGDVNWHKAITYCRDLRLAGYSDWRLPTLGELEGIYDKSTNSPGLAGHDAARDFTWHVKGNLFLTGYPWSTTQRLDDRGRPNGLVWYLNFLDGMPHDEDGGKFSGRLAGYGKRALCVRGTGK
jgi:hypothetical protein